MTLQSASLTILYLVLYKTFQNLYKEYQDKFKGLLID